MLLSPFARSMLVAVLLPISAPTSAAWEGRRANVCASFGKASLRPDGGAWSGGVVFLGACRQHRRSKCKKQNDVSDRPSMIRGSP